MTFTAPSGKKSVFHTLGGMCNDKTELQQGGSTGFLSTTKLSLTYLHSCRTPSHIQREARIGNILNTCSRFVTRNSPTFDTLLDHNHKFEGGVKNGN